MRAAYKKNVILQIIIRTRTEGAGWDITRHDDVYYYEIRDSFCTNEIIYVKLHS